jgi:hypothetical protein
MVTGSQLWHHTTIAGMQVNLAKQGMAQQAVISGVQSHRGFITGGFDTEYDHAVYGKRRRLLHKEILPFCLDVYRMRSPNITAAVLEFVCRMYV